MKEEEVTGEEKADEKPPGLEEVKSVQEEHEEEKRGQVKSVQEEHEEEKRGPGEERAGGARRREAGPSGE